MYIAKYLTIMLTESSVAPIIGSAIGNTLYRLSEIPYIG